MAANQLQIIPQAATLYPGDAQQFSLYGPWTPALWTNISAGTVDPDFSLRYVGGPSFFGSGAYTAEGGVNHVKFVMTEHCLPLAGGATQLKIRTTVGTLIGRIEILPTQIKTYNNAGTLLQTLARQLAPGEQVLIEFTQKYMQAYFGADYQTSAKPTVTGTSYPVTYEVELAGPMRHATIKIAAHSLAGNWKLRGNRSWSASGGSYIVAGAGDLFFTAGPEPGVYPLSCIIDSIALQSVADTITIPPLTISGPNTATLQSSEQVAFRTNYDSAQSNIVAWSVVSGSGSFSNGVYTASATAGVSTVRATSGNQTADITVTVGPAITPNILAAPPSSTVQFSSNLSGTVTWSVTGGGSITNGGLWSTPSVVGGLARVTATNGSAIVTLDIYIAEVWPFDPSYPVEWEAGMEELVDESEDGARWTSAKEDRDRRPYKFEFENCDINELKAAAAFRIRHGAGKPFVYQDKLLNENKVLYFDSKIKFRAAGRSRYHYNFLAREK